MASKEHALEDRLKLDKAILQENDDFLHTRAKETYDEVIRLIDDAVDLAFRPIKRKDWKESYIKYSMTHFSNHILMPLSYAIRADLLLGNIVACFFELRLMLESMVKCFWSDIKYPECTFFEDKLLSLERELSKKRVSTSKLLENSGRDYVALWGKLSGGWLHTRGIVEKIVDQMVEKSAMPTLVIPMSYTDDDLDTLMELQHRVVEFRILLKKTSNRWNRKIKPSSLDI